MNFQAEIETLIRARYPIIYIITSERRACKTFWSRSQPKRQ